MVYKSYLGATLGRRLSSIMTFIEEYYGVCFFKKYSTKKDSILAFIKKCEEKELI
jgi:hypothetical protein